MYDKTPGRSKSKNHPAKTGWAAKRISGADENKSKIERYQELQTKKGINICCSNIYTLVDPAGLEPATL